MRSVTTAASSTSPYVRGEALCTSSSTCNKDRQSSATCPGRPLFRVVFGSPLNLFSSFTLFTYLNLDFQHVAFCIGVGAGSEVQLAVPGAITYKKHWDGHRICSRGVFLREPIPKYCAHSFERILSSGIMSTISGEQLLDRSTADGLTRTYATTAFQAGKR
jgi:hypothetical protein